MDGWMDKGTGRGRGRGRERERERERWLVNSNTIEQHRYEYIS